MPSRNKALPMETREFPEYSFNEYPKMLGKREGVEKDDPTYHVIANDAAHEKKLRDELPYLPVYIPPPSSMPMSDFRENMLELARLRDENAKLRAERGDNVVIDDSAKQPEPAPRAVETPDPVPATDARALAAGEDPNGDPWTKLPENEIPAKAPPPSIKPASNKLGNKR